MSPNITTQTRKDGIAAALEVAELAAQTGKGTAHAITWKGKELVLPVASVDLDLVLLNPHSHRISAQLQSLPPIDQETVRRDPHGDEAQTIIATLLQSTPGYDRIKNALANDGQQDPGVITTSGVLVNANTRAVALRHLRQKYIKVLVLPVDATSKEITDLELRLQMEQEVKQPYSFTSSLLFIEDLINSGDYNTLEIGKALRSDLTDSKADNKKAIENVELELRLLGLIREVLTASGGALNFLYFDEKRQALLEIDQDYQKSKNTKPEEATRIRDAQLAGLIADVDYRKLREVDAALLDGYMVTAMRENASLGPHVDALLNPTVPTVGAPDGLDLLDEDEPAPSAGPSLSGLYTLLAKSGPDETIALPGGGDGFVVLPRKAVAAALHGTFMTAIENKQRDLRRIDDLSAPLVHLKDAVRSLDRAATAWISVREHPSFDHHTFNLTLEEYRRAADEFVAATAPTVSPGGSGDEKSESDRGIGSPGHAGG
jgi:hypothetical protein